MQIERINDNQIRCTLTKEDLAQRQLKLNELTYGSEKARALFKDMMTQAYEEVGFESSNIPLMIEAIPVSVDCLVLIITKVEDPEEFDTRFSRFSKGSTGGETDLSFDEPADSSYSSPGFSNLLADDPETLHYSDDAEDPEGHDQVSVSDDSDGYHFSSTHRDGDLETTVEISIENESPDSLPADLFSMSAEEMLKYLARKVRESRENPDQNPQDKVGSDLAEPGRQDLDSTNHTGENHVPDIAGQPETDWQNTRSSSRQRNTAAGQTESSRMTSQKSRSRTASPRKDSRCYYFSNFTDISRLCAVLEPFYKGASALYRDPSEGSYYLLLQREDSDKNHFKRACTLAADFGKSLDLSYGTDFYFKEHFRAILPEDAVALASSLL